MKNIRITLIIDSLGCGGAERIISNMANHWVRRGLVVSFITYQAETLDFYVLDPFVNRVELKFNLHDNIIHKLFNQNMKLRSAIKKTKPNIIISFLETTNIRVLLATVGLNIPIIISERNDPHHCPLKPSWNLLRKITYPHASCLVVQTVNALRYFTNQIQNIGKVIPNPIPLPDEGCPSGDELLTAIPRKKLIAMGRLVDQKDFGSLIKAFASIAPSNPDWILEIYGEGENLHILTERIADLGMQNRIFLPGRTKTSYAVMRSADMFVLSSRYEGFPNVLCEAMACGLPVISFDCNSGPRDIIRDGVDGVLVPPGDIAALAAAMARLMGDEEERKRLGSRAPEVLERFSLEKVMGMWEEIILNVI